jgi:DNA-binding XRE family transcriptional regulator
MEQKSVKFYRSSDFRTTVISIASEIGFITLRIDGELNAKQRRAIGKSIFVQLKPLLGFLKNVSLHHWDDAAFDFNRADERGLKTFRCAEFRTDSANFALKMRLLRLHRGLTLRELSKNVGLSETHLSEIERGLHVPYASTVKRIKEYLGFESELKKS